MPEKKKRNAKYFLTVDKPNLKLPPYRHTMNPEFVKRIVQLDKETVPGAEFYSEAMWIMPGDKSPKGMTHMDSHTHTWGEFIGFFGFNYDDIQDLGGEVEFWLEDEMFMLDKSFLVYIPAGMVHCPLVTHSQTIPTFHYTIGPGHKYE